MGIAWWRGHTGSAVGLFIGYLTGKAMAGESLGHGDIQDACLFEQRAAELSPRISVFLSTTDDYSPCREAQVK